MHHHQEHTKAKVIVYGTELTVSATIDLSSDCTDDETENDPSTGSRSD